MRKFLLLFEFVLHVIVGVSVASPSMNDGVAKHCFRHDAKVNALLDAACDEMATVPTVQGSSSSLKPWLFRRPQSSGWMELRGVS